MTNIQKMIVFIIGAIGFVTDVICLILLCKISFYAWLLGLVGYIGAALYITSIGISTMKKNEDNNEL